MRSFKNLFAAAGLLVVMGLFGCNRTDGILNPPTPTAPMNLNYSQQTAIYLGGVQIQENVAGVTGTGIHYSISPGLPAGLSIDDTSGIISGMPTAISPATNYTVTATNNLGSATVVLNLAVSWMQRISGTRNDLNSVLSTGTQWVVVGSGGAIVTSSNGADWVVRNSGTTNALLSVAWSGAQFVAVGKTGTILTSPNGLIWTSRVSGNTNNLNSVVWNGTQFVTVGDGGTILASSDGFTWTAKVSGTLASLNSILLAGTQFFVFSDTSQVFLTSTSGNGWVAKNDSGRVTNSKHLAWTGSQFVVASGYSGFSTSPDGVNWTFQSETGLNGYIYFVKWTGTQLLAATYGGIYLVTPSAGVAWNVSVSLPNYTFPDFASVSVSGSKFVAVTQSGFILTSF